MTKNPTPWNETWLITVFAIVIVPVGIAIMIGMDQTKRWIDWERLMTWMWPPKPVLCLVCANQLYVVPDRHAGMSRKFCFVCNEERL